VEFDLGGEGAVELLDGCFGRLLLLAGGLGVIDGVLLVLFRLEFLGGAFVVFFTMGGDARPLPFAAPMTRK